eukprot:2566283-Pleurochrysis_carterae.AAC.1
MSCPTPELFRSARRVLMYLHYYKTIGLRYEHSRSDGLRGYSDSDWATRHYTSGYIFTYNRAAISWSSKNRPPWPSHRARPRSWPPAKPPKR